MGTDAREDGARPEYVRTSVVATKRRSTRAAVLALSLAVGVHSSNAFAEDTGVTVSLKGPAECGSEASLHEQIQGRSSRLRIGPAEANQVKVDLQSKGGYTATVLISGPIQNSERTLEGADCKELLDAVALVIVVSLDPMDGAESTQGGAATDGSGTSPTDTNPARGDATATTDGETLGDQTAGTASTGEDPPNATAPPTWKDNYEPPDLGSPLSFSSLVPDRFGAGAGVRAHLGPAPSAMFGPEATFELLYAPESIGSTRLALAASRSWSGHVIREQGQADFTLDQLLIELCPVRFGQSRWEVRPCLTGAWGRMIASGSGTNAPQTVTRPWGFFGASARASGRPASFLEVWTAIGIGAALVRDQYQFEPVVFHTVPQEIITGALGLSALFP